MSKPQLFFVVGHKHWGKSRTLRALIGGGHQVRKTTVGNHAFLIWRMSNDDIPKVWERRIGELRAQIHARAILTLCPTEDAHPALDGLRTRYDLFFWIIRRSHRKYPSPDGRTISAGEERMLGSLGTVGVFEEMADAPLRAAAFEQFVKAHS